MHTNKNHETMVTESISSLEATLKHVVANSISLEGLSVEKRNLAVTMVSMLRDSADADNGAVPKQVTKSALRVGGAVLGTKVEGPYVCPISVAKLNKLIDNIHNGDFHLRDSAILASMMLMGLSPAEIHSMNWSSVYIENEENVDMNLSELKVQGRVLLVNKQWLKAIKKWHDAAFDLFDNESAALSADKAIFASDRTDRLSKDSIIQWYYKLGKKCGFDTSFKDYKAIIKN